MDGIINVYKEPGFTSHDVVAKLRGILHMKKIGHTGTLDPDAQGVLPVCLGKATKLCGMITDWGKTYEAVMLLGKTTDTQDISGSVLSVSEVNADERKIIDVIISFVGGYEQVPPMYSALKHNGRKLYELARQGIEVERKSRHVDIGFIKINEMNLNDDEKTVTFTVACSKGTYIRTLIDDIGKKLGCGACMLSLKRTRVGQFEIDDSLTLNQISEQTNYQTKFSLAKAFKKHFGVSTSQYREKYKPMYDEQHAVITPEIRSILPMKVFCIEVGEKYKDELRYKLIWNRLTNYAKQHNEEKLNYKFVSLSMDDPSITPMNKCRFYLGVTIDDTENDSQPGVMEVPGGRYAVFRHIGDYSLLHKLYRTIYEEWFPESKYRPQSTFSFEMYMNRPSSTLRTELMTDIYIPVTKK